MERMGCLPRRFVLLILGKEGKGIKRSDGEGDGREGRRWKRGKGMEEREGVGMEVKGMEREGTKMVGTKIEVVVVR